MRGSNMKVVCVSVIIMFFGVLISSVSCLAVTAEDLKEMMDRHEQFTLIDVRDNAAYVRSHIAGAINVPARLCGMKQFPPIGRVIVYGDGLDETPVLEAVEALNRKTGIEAEKLDGGILRWEALNYPSTRKKGFEEEHLLFITYRQLEGMSRSNPDLVILDLREPQQAIQSKSLKEQGGKTVQGKRPTDLLNKFPGVRIIKSVMTEGTKDVAAGTISAKGLRDTPGAHSELYVIIDRGDGSAEEMARRLRAAGIKRIAILAGGEESLVNSGEHESKK
ncbi:MAG: hypothetical protein AMS17_08485 [Spirochaetes bacterium DG_61]|jgi:rhodanese-related sulfurtransferase|nr:MAG: hypothetical protein AMS17_08485 [Spirochaetes bacterium DG_61]